MRNINIIGLLKNIKNLYLILAIIIAFVFTLSVAYVKYSTRN